MRRATAAALVCIALAVAPSCSTVPSRSTMIAVPPTLSLAQIEDAVRVALKSDREGRGWMRAQWQIESSVPGRIVSRVGVEQKSLRVAIEYSRESVVTTILGIHEPGRGVGSIPDWADAWHTGLDRRIEEELKWSARSPQ